MPALLALRSPAFLPNSLTALLFENHYPYWIALLLLAAVLIFVARSRQNPRMLRSGQILLGLTLLWLVAARLIDTPAERLYAAHLGLATAAEKHDVDLLLTYFEPKFTVGSINIRPDTADAKKEIRSRIDQLGIKETLFRQYAITLNPDASAATRFTALTKCDAGALLTTWLVTWTDVPNSDWKIRDATLEKLNNEPVVPGPLMP